jgi:uncharacterized protein involved in outer membrane biogenesis
MGMTTKQKRFFFIASSVIGIFLVSLVALVHYININSYKPQIEAAVHDHLGMDLKINGEMGIGIFPGFGVSLSDVNLRNKGTDLLTVKKVRVGLKLFPLIRHKVAITDCELVGPVISVVRGADGTFNFETQTAEKKAERKSVPLPLLTIRKLTVSGGSIVYSDKKSGGRNELNDCDLAIKKLSFSGKIEDPLRTIALSGDLTCRSLKIGHFTATNLRCPIEAGNGILNFGPFVVDAFGGTGRGRVEVDARGKPAHFKLGFKTAAFSLPAAQGKSDAGPELRNLELNVTDLSFSGDDKQKTLANISLAGNARCGSMKIKRLEVSDLRLTMKGEKGVFEIAPISMDFYGGAGKGSLRADLSGDVPRYSIKLSASRFSSEQFLAGFSDKKIVKGEMDFFAQLTAAGENSREMKRGLGGEVTLKGENLFLYGLDLDQLLTKIEESRSFSLVDVGAYFFVGPFGTLFTKGYNFADIAVHAKGGQSAVRQLVSKWRLTRGVAEAEDVALATNRHRLAIKGKLDFVGDRFDNMTVAVVDKKGCAALTQKISGPFNKPQVEKVNVLTSLVAPVLGLVGKVGKLFTGGKCKVFYTGSVKPPG